MGLEETAMFNHFPTIQQNELLINYEKLLGQLKLANLDLKLNKMDEEGICNGLSYCYALYAKEGRREEFISILKFMTSLSEGNLKNLVAAYKKNSNLLVSLENKALIRFSKIIELLDAINLAQNNQSLKQISANWDKTYSFICTTENLTQFLESFKMKNNQVAFVDFGIHVFYIEKTSHGFYLFEPNAIDKGALISFIKNEKELALKIITHCKKHILKNNLVSFSLTQISYGENHRKIIEALLKIEEKIADPAIKKYIADYFDKRISLSELCFAVIEITNELTKKNLLSLELLSLTKKIATFIQTEDDFMNQTVFSCLKHINQTAFKFQISLLCLAVRTNSIHLVKKLLTNNVDPNQHTKLPNEDAPIHYAASKNALEIAKLLLENGANPNEADKNGDTVLHRASSKGNLEMVQLLLKNKANPHQTNNEGHIPLHRAVAGGNLEIVQLLLENGADIHYKTKKGVTPLHLAKFVSEKHPEMVPLLEKYNKKPNSALEKASPRPKI